MLCASHIIPWAHNVERRADPANGLSLCSFHDRAFDRGLVAIDSGGIVLISDCVRRKNVPKLHIVGFLEIEGKLLRMPHRFGPDPRALEYHREGIFRAGKD